MCSQCCDRKVLVRPFRPSRSSALSGEIHRPITWRCSFACGNQRHVTRGVGNLELQRTRCLLPLRCRSKKRCHEQAGLETAHAEPPKTDHLIDTDAGDAEQQHCTRALSELKETLCCADGVVARSLWHAGLVEDCTNKPRFRIV